VRQKRSTGPSRVVPHRSTTPARTCLTSLFGWEAVSQADVAALQAPVHELLNVSMEQAARRTTVREDHQVCAFVFCLLFLAVLCVSFFSCFRPTQSRLVDSVSVHSAATSAWLTASHPNSEVKQVRAGVVLRWGTTREGPVLRFCLT
jgi:hypothetical protein